ncbi:MAG: DoxX family protein [Saccharothrix sp.]|nr:DoxX family protein [Saccharothrix sp.]
MDGDLMGQPGAGREAPARWSPGTWLDASSRAVDRVLGRVLDRSVPLLRIALGVVVVWFGVLKIAGTSPVRDLLAGTVPFLPAAPFVPMLGVFEVLAGTALVVGIRVRLVAGLIALRLLAMVLVPVVQPAVAFRSGNPLLLTVTGEFLVKDLVLLAAVLVVAAQQGRRC